ncbi:uncharacterized protein [Eurosta solidaginis]|uniref:uncharacterized protein n=1 Tax=Eurosta solidaginis TaxID=178769 RepID=UPI003530B3EA
MSTNYEDMPTNQQADFSQSVRKKVSIVWRYFEKLDRWRVRCNICRHEQNYQGTTGNILRHLKNKHDIDVSLKAQKSNPGLIQKLQNSVEENYRTGDELDYGDNVATKNEHGLVRSPRKQPKYDRNNSISGTDIGDPYTDSTFQLYNNYSEEQSYKNTNKNLMDKQKYSPEEERILAEIEYFREKAGYYRMQKNLVALQAKKVKYELDHL